MQEIFEVLNEESKGLEFSTVPEFVKHPPYGHTITLHTRSGNFTGVLFTQTNEVSFLRDSESEQIHIIMRDGVDSITYHGIEDDWNVQIDGAISQNMSPE